eukprot:57633-Pyramimonas_sp.AAC.1
MVSSPRMDADTSLGSLGTSSLVRRSASRLMAAVLAAACALSADVQQTPVTPLLGASPLKLR